MPDEDQSDDIKILTPGDSPEASAPAAAPPAALNNTGESADVVALRAENAQLRATVEDLNHQLSEAADGQAVERQAPPKEPALIGENWSSMTAAEAQAAGCKRTVLCRDGYFVPGN